MPCDWPYRKSYAARTLDRCVSYRRGVIGDGVFNPGYADWCWHTGFCCCDLDLYPMTFIYELHPYSADLDLVRFNVPLGTFLGHFGDSGVNMASVRIVPAVSPPVHWKFCDDDDGSVVGLKTELHSSIFYPLLAQFHLSPWKDVLYSLWRDRLTAPIQRRWPHLHWTRHQMVLKWLLPDQLACLLPSLTARHWKEIASSGKALTVFLACIMSKIEKAAYACFTWQRANW